MKYLKKVTLRNFQSHKNTVVEFDKGLNIIVGPSDTGKSAIIRGIKWVLYNEPAGDYFIREGENEASVTLEFSNDIKVERLRNRSKNAYILHDIDGEELVFEGFGSKVPQEIINLLSIKKIPLDSNESNSINLGEQLEGAFLLSEKASTRASAIGRLIGVNLVDDALKDTLRDMRNTSIKKRTISESIEEVEEELVEYEYLDDLKENIDKLEAIRNIISRKNNKKSLLIDLRESYNDIVLGKKEFENILEELSKIDILEKNIYLIENNNIKLNSYKKINTEFKKVKYDIGISKELLMELKDIEDVESKVKKINNSKEKLKTLKKLETQMKYNNIEDKNIKFINEKIKGLTYINNNISYIEDNLTRLNFLNNISTKMNSIDKSIKIGESYTGKLKNLYKLDIIFKDLSLIIGKRNQLLNTSKELDEVSLKIKNQNKILKKNKINIDNNLKKYEELLKKHEICPFCLSEINENKIDHIIEHYT